MRACDVAAAHGHRSLLWALNPRVPLAALLRPLPSDPSVPTLASLAAAALRQWLMQQLAGLREAAAAAAVARSTEGGQLLSKRGSRRGSRAASREGSAHGGTGYAVLAAAAGAALLPAAVAARLGRRSGSSGPRVVPATGSLHAWPASQGSGLAAHHVRRASDGGGGTSSALHSLRLFSSVHSGSVGGSRRSTGTHPPQFAVGGATTATSLPHASPAGDAAGPPCGSVAGCRTATSVTSVAGERHEPPCWLCCGLEVVQPDGQGIRRLRQDSIPAVQKGLPAIVTHSKRYCPPVTTPSPTPTSLQAAPCAWTAA